MEKKELTVEEILKINDIREIFKLGINNVLEAFEREDYHLMSERDEDGNIIDLFLGKVEE